MATTNADPEIEVSVEADDATREANDDPPGAGRHADATGRPEARSTERFDGAAVSPSTAVVELVADRDGVDPLELPPLWSAVDPDALDALVRTDGRSPGGDVVSVSFTYEGYAVTVRGGGSAVGGLTADDR